MVRTDANAPGSGVIEISTKKSVVLIWLSDKLQFVEPGRYADKLKFGGLSI
jgi:hypothetical protein